jgi:hypothetical protein
MARATLKTTSSALKGEPSWNFTFGRSLKRQPLAAFERRPRHREPPLDLEVLVASHERLEDLREHAVVVERGERVRIHRAGIELRGEAEGLGVRGARDREEQQDAKDSHQGW